MDILGLKGQQEGIGEGENKYILILTMSPFALT